MIGIAITALSYSAVSHSGGTYFVSWGAMAVGAWRLLLGLYQLLRGMFSDPPVPGATMGASAFAAAPAPASSFAAMSGEPPTAMLVIGGLLIVQALVRLGFLVKLLLQVGGTYLTYPTFLFLSVIVPTALGVGGLVAGGLLMTRSATARGFGLVFCAVALLFQLYGVGNILLAQLKSTYQLPLITMILIPTHIVIYVAALIVLARAPSPNVSYPAGVPRA
jgi:hypothetical protein